MLYPTHQFFLTGQAVYLLLFNINSEDNGRLLYWLKQIRALSKGPAPSVILVQLLQQFICDFFKVGTHADIYINKYLKKSTPEECQAALNALMDSTAQKYALQGIRARVAVSCNKKLGLDELMMHICSLSEQPHCKTKFRLFSTLPSSPTSRVFMAAFTC